MIYRKCVVYAVYYKAAHMNRPFCSFQRESFRLLNTSFVFTWDESLHTTEKYFRKFCDIFGFLSNIIYILAVYRRFVHSKTLHNIAFL